MPPRPNFTLRSSSSPPTTSFSIRSFTAAVSRKMFWLIKGGNRNGWMLSRNSLASPSPPAASSTPPERTLGDERLGELAEKLVIRHNGARHFPSRRRFLENLALLVIDEHQIHVGTVIKFLPAEFAEANHTKRRIGRAHV